MNGVIVRGYSDSELCRGSKTPVIWKRSRTAGVAGDGLAILIVASERNFHIHVRGKRQDNGFLLFADIVIDNKDGDDRTCLAFGNDDDGAASAQTRIRCCAIAIGNIFISRTVRPWHGVGAASVGGTRSDNQIKIFSARVACTFLSIVNKENQSSLRSGRLKLDKKQFGLAFLKLHRVPLGEAKGPRRFRHIIDSYCVYARISHIPLVFIFAHNRESEHGSGTRSA